MTQGVRAVIGGSSGGTFVAGLGGVADGPLPQEMSGMAVVMKEVALGMVHFFRTAGTAGLALAAFGTKRCWSSLHTKNALVRVPPSVMVVTSASYRDVFSSSSAMKRTVRSTCVFIGPFGPPRSSWNSNVVTERMGFNSGKEK